MLETCTSWTIWNTFTYLRFSQNLINTFKYLFRKLHTCLTQGLTPCLILSFLTSFSSTPIIPPSCLSENPACLASIKSSRCKDPLKFNITVLLQKFNEPVVFVRADKFRVYWRVFALWFDWIINIGSSSSIYYGREESPIPLPAEMQRKCKSGTHTAGHWDNTTRLSDLGFV